MDSINLVKHQYNQNNVDVGNTVAVDIGYIYPAIVEGLKLDNKNRKIYAYLKTFKNRCPVRVDVSDCKKIENNI